VHLCWVGEIGVTLGEGGSGGGCIGEGGFDVVEREWCLGFAVVWLLAKKEDLKRGAMDGKRFYTINTQHFAKNKGLFYS
jgi:hypothetical protein